MSSKDKMQLSTGAKWPEVAVFAYVTKKEKKDLTLYYFDLPRVKWEMRSNELQNENDVLEKPIQRISLRLQIEY